MKFLESYELQFKVACNMMKYGGHFVQLLGEMILFSDPENLKKIFQTWENYINEYLPKNWDNHESN